MKPAPTSIARGRGAARERGVVLFVALIVMVALSLAGIALIRSVDTATLVAGNLAFRQSATPVSNAAVEKAVVDLFQVPPSIADTTKDNTDLNYRATWLGTDNALGVPDVLSDPKKYVGQKISDASTGMTASYVIERSCTAAGVATPGTCDMMPPKQAPGTTAAELDKVALPRVPFYRLTVRVDGPRQTVAYAQAILR